MVGVVVVAAMAEAVVVEMEEGAVAEEEMVAVESLMAFDDVARGCVLTVLFFSRGKCRQACIQHHDFANLYLVTNAVTQRVAEHLLF